LRKKFKEYYQNSKGEKTMETNFKILNKAKKSSSWLKNISIQKKLLLLSGVVILCLFFVIYASLKAISSIGSSQKFLYEVEFPTTLNLSKLSVDLARERFDLRRMLVATLYSDKVSWHQEIMELTNDIKEKVIVLEKLSQDVPYIQTYVQAFISERDSFLTIRDKQIIPAIYESKQINGVSDVLIDEQSNLSERMRNQIFMASSFSEEHDKLIMSESKKSLDKLTMVLIIVGAIAFLFSIFSSVYLVRLIANPLKKLSEISEKVAYGDLSLKIPPLIRNDEVGALWMSFSMMLGTLQSVTKETNQLVEELSNDINSIKVDEDPGSVRKAIISVQEKIEKLGKLMGEYKL
jgi:methyl-accepting chemotaxis protein